MSEIEPARAALRLSGRHARPLGAHPRFRPARRSLEDDGDAGDGRHHPPPDPQDTVTLSAAARAIVANPGRIPDPRPPPSTAGAAGPQAYPPPAPQPQRREEPPSPPGADAAGLAAIDARRQADFNESWLAEQEVSALRIVASPSVDPVGLIQKVDAMLSRDVPIVWTAVDGFDAADVNELLSVLVLHRRAPLLLVSQETEAPVDLGEAERALFWSAFDRGPVPEAWHAYAQTCWLAVITDVDEADRAGHSVDAAIAAVQAVAPTAERLLVSLDGRRGLDRLAEWMALPRYE